jgi:hypothetical protein
MSSDTMISTPAASTLSRELQKRDRDWRKPAVTIERGETLRGGQAS